MDKENCPSNPINDPKSIKQKLDQDFEKENSWPKKKTKRETHKRVREGGFTKP